MNINDELIAYLEDLSCISLADGEKDRLRGDLQDILGYMAKIGEIDTSDVPERSHPFDNVNAFREDVAGDSFDRELILQNAPAKNKEAFIAPKTVE